MQIKNRHSRLKKSKPQLTAAALALTVLALLTLPGPVLAEDQHQIKGKEAGAVSAVSFQFPFSHQSTAAEGRASHLGHYTLTVNFVVDVRTGTATGVGTLTSANGDMLFLDEIGHVVAGSNFLKTLAIYTITGGTGRFEGAAGTITSDFTFDIAVNAGVSPNPYTAVLAGTIVLADEDEQD